MRSSMVRRVSAADIVYFNCFRAAFGIFIGLAALLVVMIVRPLFVAPPELPAPRHTHRQLELANETAGWGWMHWSTDDSAAARGIFMISCAQALLLTLCFGACHFRPTWRSG